MSTTLIYLFDPLCGWCYGAAPALARAATLPGVTLETLPTGLFAGAGARAMDATFTDYAWRNDQRIAQLTGQPFSERYRQQVLGRHGSRFDSEPATLALIATALENVAQMPLVLSAIQHARYVDGLDVTALQTLSSVLVHAGLPQAATRITAPDAELKTAYHDYLLRARRLMQHAHIQGVPAFLAVHENRAQLLDTAAVYANPDALASQLALATSFDNANDPVPSPPPDSPKE